MMDTTGQNFVDAPFLEDVDVRWEILSEKVKRKKLVHDQQFMLVRVEFEEGGIGELHCHPHTQMTHIERGIFEVEIDGKKKILKKGDSFYVLSNSLHGVRCLENGTLMDIFSPMREDFVS